MVVMNKKIVILTISVLLLLVPVIGIYAVPNNQPDMLLTKIQQIWEVIMSEDFSTLPHKYTFSGQVTDTATSNEVGTTIILYDGDTIADFKISARVYNNEELVPIGADVADVYVVAHVGDSPVPEPLPSTYEWVGHSKWVSYKLDTDTPYKPLEFSSDYVFIFINDLSDIDGYSQTCYYSGVYYK